MYYLPTRFPSTAAHIRWRYYYMLSFFYWRVLMPLLCRCRCARRWNLWRICYAEMMFLRLGWNSLSKCQKSIPTRTTSSVDEWALEYVKCSSTSSVKCLIRKVANRTQWNYCSNFYNYMSIYTWVFQNPDAVGKDNESFSLNISKHARR